MVAQPTSLRYVGGDCYIIGVPACDHIAPTLTEATRLVATGLYEFMPDVVEIDDEEGETDE